MRPDLSIEASLNGRVIGIDEVGRGALAGPLVVAGVIINDPTHLNEVNDSKKLSKVKREKLYEIIYNSCDVAISVISPQVIDEINVLQATLLGMRNVLNQLKWNHALIDGNISPIRNNDKVIPVVKGDNKSLSIAAASIIAKVYRDRLMSDLHNQFIDYCWQSNVGYGSKNHIDAIIEYGHTIHHRLSFIKKYLHT